MPLVNRKKVCNFLLRSALNLQGTSGIGLSLSDEIVEAGAFRTDNFEFDASLETVQIFLESWTASMLALWTFLFSVIFRKMRVEMIADCGREGLNLVEIKVADFICSDGTQEYPRLRPF